VGYGGLVSRCSTTKCGHGLRQEGKVGREDLVVLGFLSAAFSLRSKRLRSMLSKRGNHCLCSYVRLQTIECSNDVRCAVAVVDAPDSFHVPCCSNANRSKRTVHDVPGFVSIPSVFDRVVRSAECPVIVAVVARPISSTPICSQSPTPPTDSTRPTDRPLQTSLPASHRPAVPPSDHKLYLAHLV
jgi:hypothetical protein